jgi:hypothetical protein
VEYIGLDAWWRPGQVQPGPHRTRLGRFGSFCNCRRSSNRWRGAQHDIQIILDENRPFCQDRLGTNICNVGDGLQPTNGVFRFAAGREPPRDWRGASDHRGVGPATRGGAERRRRRGLGRCRATQGREPAADAREVRSPGQWRLRARECVRAWVREFVGLVGLGGSRRREADRTTAIGPPAATGWLRCGKQHRLADQALPHRGCGGGVGSSSRAMCARMLQPNEHTTRFESHDQEGLHLGSTNRKAGTAAQPLPLDSGSVEGSPGRLGVHAAAEAAEAERVRAGMDHL